METQGNRVVQPGQEAWTPRDLEHFQKRLLDERKRAVAQMQQFGEDLRSTEESDGDSSSWRFHMADEGTDTFDREQTFLLASREGRLLSHIDDALRRLYRTPGRYGRCDECGILIAFDRLDAIPYAMTCVSCKMGWEGGRAD